MIQLPEIEHQIMESLAGSGPAGIAQLAAALDIDQSLVHAACTALVGRELAQIDETRFQELSLPESSPWRAAGGKLPEREIIAAIDALGGTAQLTELPAHCSLDQRSVGQSLRWLKTKGWCQQRGRELSLTDGGRAALQAPGADELLLRALEDASPLRGDQLPADLDLPAALKLLNKRKGMIKLRERKTRQARLSAAGRQAWDAGQVELRRQVNLLTSEMLHDGSWRDVDFRPYDVSLETARVSPGKGHPFRRVLAQTRRVFLELGFTEVVSPLVESSFWNFDALFQPQDHPAREMQDTFYIAQPSTTRLPAGDYAAAVGRTHEDGGDTGSVGWRYRWSRQLAHRPVLRTHCTAATVRALAADPSAPRKAFCVGPVFRRETVDYKHLPVFYQVDGLIIDEHASFASLLGVLSAFYRKMGFEKFTFRPAFFPYTEPSVEVFVYVEERKDWMELGGAGVFRPEVTEPAGCDKPVLAWGLGLERIAMLRHGMNDIRDLYMADLDWLRSVPLCR